MLVKRGHLDGRAAGEREGRDQDVVVEAMQLLALLRVRSVEEHALDLHHVLAPSRRAPAPGEDVRDPRRVAPRPALLAREHGQELAGLARVVVFRVRSEEIDDGQSVSGVERGAAGRVC
jgi:hypothetical protein